MLYCAALRQPWQHVFSVAPLLHYPSAPLNLRVKISTRQIQVKCNANLLRLAYFAQHSLGAWRGFNQLTQPSPKLTNGNLSINPFPQFYFQPGLKGNTIFNQNKKTGSAPESAATGKLRVNLTQSASQSPNPIPEVGKGNPALKGST